MSRSIFLVSAAAVPLLVDASFKGAALLLLAGVCTLLMRRSSAAARHMVWLTALLALLLVPVLSLALPDWRVLPHWAVLEKGTNATEGSSVALPMPSSSPNGLPLITSGEGVSETVTPSPVVFPSIPPQPLSESSPPTVVSTSPAKAVPLMATEWLFPIWGIGCTLLLVRLAAAHFLLRRNLARCESAPDSLVSALTTAAKETGYHKPVRLLVDHERTIPVVWGIFRPSLLLPAEATAWSAEQLRSVLLHEMAHIKRRDPLVQCITQIACAIHWFNPLAWIAAWRLHVERERACDDMVLTSGVRPSAYAEHLLHVATNLSAARWTNACGLAMARKSSIEGRLLAVLSDKLNRRRLTRALTAAAILLSAAIAIPIAMLRAADEKSSPPQETKKAETVKEGNEADTPGVFVIDDEALELPPPGPGARRSARLKPATEEKLAWGKDVNGLRAALVSLRPQPDLKQGTVVDLNLVVQNVSDAPVKLRGGSPLPTANLACLLPGKTEVDVLQNIVDILSSVDEFTLQPREVGVMSLMSVCIGQLDANAKSAHDRSVGYSTGKVVGVLAGFTGSVSFGNSAEGFWKGTLPLGKLTINPGDEAQGAPKRKDARTLYEIWQRHARLSGDIPGALIGELAAAVKVFIGYNPTWETVPKLKEILPRLDATHDWKASDAIALLDEMAAVQDSPLKTAAEKMTAATIRKGEPLPEKFAKVIWGETQPNGLRAAWMLEPGGAEHRVGTALKARLLVQNTGKLPVMARVPTWHQGDVSARDATGAEVEVSGISWTTIAMLVPVRLGPGEFIEINAPGVGLGPRAGMGPWAGPRVGSNVLAKDGTELTLTHGSLALDGSGVGMREDAPHIIGPGWWQAHIKARLARELPLPASGAKRTLHLLDRAMRELFASTPTADEIDAFATDQTDGAFDALVQRLAARTDVVEFSASLTTAPVKFRVLAPDVNADKTPRVVLGPGEYPLSGGSATHGAVTLKIVGRPVGDRRTNDAQLLYQPAEATGKLPPDPHKLELPDGWGTWAIVCRPGDGFFYVLHKGGARKIDYTKPHEFTDTPATDLPAEFRDEVKRQLDIAGVPAESKAEIFQTAPPATTPEPKSPEAGPRADDAALHPKHESAQKLMKSWQRYARTDGKIPGALIASLADVVDWTLWTDGWLTPQNADQAARLAELKFTHTRLKVTGPQAAPYVAKLTALRARIDGSHDWTPAEAVAMLDEVTAITTEPVHLANRPFEFDESRKISPGKPLPKGLESAAWGAPAGNGLRAAWLLEPAPSVAWASIAEFSYPLGSVLKARVLFHNAGKAPVVFQTETWHQNDGHKAHGAKGAEIPVKATWFTGITPTSKFRLAPGEYCEVSGHGIAIGAGEYKDEQSTGAVGAIIEAKEGDTVTLSHTVDAAEGGWTTPGDSKDPAALQKRFFEERKEPLPVGIGSRAVIIRSLTLDITGELPTPEDRAAFEADQTPEAIGKLIARLLAKADGLIWKGKLPTGETKFRVIASDLNAAKAPRTATDPGRYVLGDGVHLQVRQVTEGDKRTNSAEILFFGPDPKKESPHKPYQIGFYVPDSAYAFVWERGANTLWVTEISEGEPIRPWLLGSPERPGPQKVTVRAFDFSNHADVKLTHVSSSENGGDWSWGKIVPAAFHQPVLTALGERGKRLRDFLPAGESRKLGTMNLEIIPNPNVSEPGYPALKGLLLKPQPTVQTPAPANGNIVSTEPGGVSIVTSASYKTDAYPLAEGLSIVVRSELYHGADTSTDVVAHWAATENRSAAHAVFQVASDTMGNRQPWAVLWENGAPALWFAIGKSYMMSGKAAGKTHPLTQLVRIDMSDPENLVSHEFSGIPDAGGPSAAVLEKLRTRMTWDGTGTETTRTLRWAQPTVKAGKTPGILHVFTRDAGKFQVSNGKPCDLDGLRGSIEEEGKDFAGAPHQFTLVGPPSHWERMQQAAGRLRGWHPTIAGGEEATPASTDQKVTSEADARPRQKIDWSKGPSWNGLSEPFDPAKALALAEAVKKSDGDIDDDRRRLMFMILQATAERAPELRPLLEDKELRHKDDDFQSFALALAAYDFAVNGNKKGLQFILDTLAAGPAGDVQAAVPLGFIDEWDLSIAAHEKHFDKGSDGAAGEARMMFWEERKFFFPEGLARFQKAALAAIKLDAESLNGTWKGSKDGVTVEVLLGKEQRWEVRHGDKLLKANLISRPAETGKFILIEPSDKGRPAPFGILSRGERGELHLEFRPQSGPWVTNIVLEKQLGAVNERPDGQPREWKVRVVDGSTGREQPGVTLVAWVFPREGGQGRRVEHVADGRDWAIKLAENEHATLACEDAVWVGGGGSFHIGNLPPVKPNAVSDRKGARHTDPDKTFELRVWRGASVAGRVLLPGGKPAVGVHVMLGARIDSQEWIQRLGLENMSRLSFDHGEYPNWHSTAVTNERGEFEGAFPPGEACSFTTITCRTKDSLNYEEKRETALPGDGKSTIQLEAGVRVFGRVVDTDGKPVSRAEVFASGQHRHEDTSGQTDGEGRYELRVRPGVSQVAVDIRERNEKGEVTSHNATGIHAPENVAIPEGSTEFARNFRIMRLTDAGPVLPPGGKPQRARDAAVSFQNYGKPIAEFAWIKGPWGAEKDGLSLALELDTEKADQWRAGGTVAGELYVKNNSETPVTFPQHFAMHVGLAVTARDLDGKDHPARITMWEGCPALHHLTLPPGHAARVKIFTLQIDAPGSPERQTGGWLKVPPGDYKLRARWSDAHAMWAHEGEWTGSMESGEVELKITGGGDSDVKKTSQQTPNPNNNPPTAASEYVTVSIEKDGSLSYERTAITLAELNSMAAENTKKWFTIRADEEVPYARAVEVLDTLRVAGVAEITFSEGRMGDGRYRVANRTGNYEFDATHKFSICMPSGRQQWFTVIWPTKDGRPARRLRFYPELSAEGRTPWAVAWEPNTNVLWWVDDAHIGRMTLGDPDKISVSRAARMSWNEAQFGLTDEVKVAFRRLGYAVGYDGPPGSGPAGVVHSAEILSAEVLKADGTAVDHPQVRPGGEWSEAWRELSATVAAARGTPEVELESLIAWGEAKDGLRSGVLMTDRMKRGGRTEARLVVRNVSDKSVTVNLSPVPNRIAVTATAADGSRLEVHKVILRGVDPSFSYTFKPGQQLEFAAPPIQFGVERNADGKVQTPGFPICGVETGPGTVSIRYSLTNVHAPDSGVVKVTSE